MMKSLIIVVYLIASLVNIRAQEIAVQSCVINPQDCTAFSSPRIDLNGDITAAVKIYYPEKSNLDFRGNVVGEVSKNEDFYTVYLVGGTKQLHIYKDGTVPLEVDFTQYTDNHKGLIAGKTYELYLKNVSTTKKNFGKGSNIVIFISNTPFSKLIVDGQQWQINGTSAKRLMPYGEYEYEATSTTNQTIRGTVEVTKSFGNKIVNLQFK